MAELFDDLPVSCGPLRAVPGRARLREPVRDEVHLDVVDLDALIGLDHPARTFWVYAERIDFADFEAKVLAREGAPGMAQTSPRLLLALWLYATSEGVGSARELARLCTSLLAYRWLCGGVGVNHHMLSDFRTHEAARIDGLLVAHVARLSLAGLIALDEIAQDGVRIRARAGGASFRRRRTLERELDKAKAVLDALAREATEDPGASDRRRKAAQARVANERLARVEAALTALDAVEAIRAKRAVTNANETKTQGAPRASTTDAQARVMKMADGGFRPAYNVQFASLPGNGIIVALDVATTGSDAGLAEPMAARIEALFGRRPQRHLVDAGYQSAADIEAAHAAKTAFYSAPRKSKGGRDPYAARRGDKSGVADWRRRMASDTGKTIYKRRCQCELVHAKLRNLGLDRLLVRGVDKVKMWMTRFALAMNILTEHRLRAAA